MDRERERESSIKDGESTNKDQMNTLGCMNGMIIRAACIV
jgi:hypothetical protein